MGVIIRRIKIGVVANFRGQLHHHIRLPMQNALPQFGIITQRCSLSRKKFLQSLANLSPSRPAEREKFIQTIAREQSSIGQTFEMPRFFQCRKIDNVITKRDADACWIIAWFENAERKILQRKMRIFSDFDKRTKSHAYDLTTKITEDTKS